MLFSWADVYIKMEGPLLWMLDSDAGSRGSQSPDPDAGKVSGGFQL